MKCELDSGYATDIMSRWKDFSTLHFFLVDMTRVRLAMRTGQAGSDYINASYVDVSRLAIYVKDFQRWSIGNFTGFVVRP